MAKRSYKQNKLSIIGASLPEYLGKLFRFGALVVISGFALVIMSICFSLANAYLEGEGGDFDDVVWVGAFLLLDILPQPSGVSFSPDLQIAGRLTGLVLTGLFAGFSVNIMATPVNPIAFSRNAVISLRRRKLRIRYWIRQPEKTGLCNARIDVAILDESESNKGESDIDRKFTFSEPKDISSIPYEIYSTIRGVRFVDIDLDQRSSGLGATTLQEALRLLASSDSMRLVVTIVGSLSDGRVLVRRTAYTRKSVVQGYDFLTIRRDELENEWRYAQDAESLEKRYGASISCRGKVTSSKREAFKLFHEHFDVVYGEERWEKRWAVEGLDARPEDLFVFPKGFVAARSFRLYECLWAVFNFFRRVRRRIKRLFCRISE